MESPTSQPLYYVFHAIPFTKNYGMKKYTKHDKRMFTSILDGGKEWEDKKIDEKIQSLRGNNFETYRVELARKEGISFEFIKIVRDIQFR